MKKLWTNFHSDFIASIVVFLVAIPLCLGIALASGASPFAGILTGIIGGIVVGLISQSPISVSGPAAGMIAVVLAATSALGSFHAFLLALFLAGILQLFIGAFRAGFIAAYIPLNVIQGLLAAIGILIILKQLPLAFGYMGDTAHLQEALKITEETFDISPLLNLSTHINLGASLITLASLLTLISWAKLPFKFCKAVPAAIVTVIFAIVLNELFDAFFPTLALYSSHLVNIPVNENFSSMLLHFEHPKFSDWGNHNVYMYAAMLAMVASLETLLNLEAAEKLSPKARHSSRNRELIAQGIGNTLSGLLGGLPITSVIVRSSVNINAGAKTKLSAILHGLLLFISLAFIPEWLNKIPIASLAAILLYTGYKLTRASLFKEMYQKGFNCFFPFLVTVVAIVFSNLLMGVLIGLGVSLFFILRESSKNQFLTVNEIHPSGEVLRLILPQQVTFLNKAAIIATLKAIPDHHRVILDARATDYIDHDMLEIFNDFKKYQSVEKNLSLNLEGFKNHYKIPNQTNFVTATTYDVQTNLTPQKILSILLEGNQRFINNTPINKNYPQQIAATLSAQHPIAVMLGCIDSRVPVELIFDLSVGDAFVARIAGNILNSDIIGSIEYACHVAGAKLIVILGHENCGAIRAACDKVSFGHVASIVHKIQPAIEHETTTQTNRNGENPAFVSHVAAYNVTLVKQEIYEKSAILRKLIDAGSVGLVSAMYDVATGSIKLSEA